MICIAHWDECRWWWCNNGFSLIFFFWITFTLCSHIKQKPIFNAEKWKWNALNTNCVRFAKCQITFKCAWIQFESWRSTIWMLPFQCCAGSTTIHKISNIWQQPKHNESCHAKKFLLLSKIIDHSMCLPLKLRFQVVSSF